MRNNDWGLVRSTKSGKVDKRTSIAKALQAQGERSIDKKRSILYTIEKKDEVSGKNQTP